MNSDTKTVIVVLVLVVALGGVIWFVTSQDDKKTTTDPKKDAGVNSGDKALAGAGCAAIGMPPQLCEAFAGDFMPSAHSVVKNASEGVAEQANKVTDTALNAYGGYVNTAVGLGGKVINLPGNVAKKAWGYGEAAFDSGEKLIGKVASTLCFWCDEPPKPQPPVVAPPIRASAPGATGVQAGGGRGTATGAAAKDPTIMAYIERAKAEGGGLAVNQANRDAAYTNIVNQSGGKVANMQSTAPSNRQASTGGKPPVTAPSVRPNTQAPALQRKVS